MILPHKMEDRRGFTNIIMNLRLNVENIPKNSVIIKVDCTNLHAWGIAMVHPAPAEGACQDTKCGSRADMPHIAPSSIPDGVCHTPDSALKVP